MRAATCAASKSICRLTLSHTRPLAHRQAPMVRSHAGATDSVHQVVQLSKGTRLHLQIGDLTKWSGDAIVNAANERMLGGGGVDGAIHRAAGSELYEACKASPEASPGVRCPTGEARLTRGFKLPAKYVIHTVGPVYKSEKDSAPLLYNAHRSCLDLAKEHKLKSIAFPAISCGVFGYPAKDAAATAFKACKDAESGLEDIHFVFFGRGTYDDFFQGAEGLEWLGPFESL